MTDADKKKGDERPQRRYLPLWCADRHYKTGEQVSIRGLPSSYAMVLVVVPLAAGRKLSISRRIRGRRRTLAGVGKRFVQRGLQGT